MKAPQIEPTRYQHFIENLMHIFIIVTLLGICLKVLLF